MAEIVAFASTVPPPPPPPASPLGGFSLGGLAASLAVGVISALFRPPRSIGFIVPGVTVEEAGRDDLEITRHPVETGATITDHAYKLPAEITIRAGWSDSGSLPGYCVAVYAALLNLQASRQPFTVITGKRLYPNMLMASLAQTTDSTSENALMAVIVCREVILVKSLVTTSAPRSQQAQPQNTAPTAPSGEKQAVPSNDSVLHRTIGGPGYSKAPAALTGPGHPA